MLRVKLYHDQMRVIIINFIFNKKINEKASKNKKLDSPNHSDSDGSADSNLKTTGSSSDTEDL
jgi:hypothetical protein